MTGMERPNTSPPIVAGVGLGFLLLIAAVWASDTSVAASLAMTGGIVLAGVGTIAVIAPASLYPKPR